jgi:hypothetical protein
VTGIRCGAVSNILPNVEGQFMAQNGSNKM